VPAHLVHVQLRELHAGRGLEGLPALFARIAEAGCCANAFVPEDHIVASLAPRNVIKRLLRPGPRLVIGTAMVTARNCA